MASITVRRLDDVVKRRLRVLAAEHGRSLEAEVREILNRSANLPAQAPQAKTGLDLFRGLRDVVEKHGGFELEIAPRTPMRNVDLGQKAATFAKSSNKQNKARRGRKKS